VTKIVLPMLFFKEHNMLTFNQALILANGHVFTSGKFTDDELAKTWRPCETKENILLQLVSEGNVELAKMEQKLYLELTKMYNKLVCTFSDTTPTTPTIPSNEYIKWALDNGVLTEVKPFHKKTVAKAKNLHKVELMLINYLPTLDKRTNKNSLAFNRKHDEFSQKFTFPPSTLLKYLTEIITLKWWNNLPEDAQKYLKKPVN